MQDQFDIMQLALSIFAFHVSWKELSESESEQKTAGGYDADTPSKFSDHSIEFILMEVTLIMYSFTSKYEIFYEKKKISDGSQPFNWKNSKKSGKVMKYFPDKSHHRSLPVVMMDTYEHSSNMFNK